MAKKQRKSKKERMLRREVEILRAQLKINEVPEKSYSSQKDISKEIVSQNTNTSKPKKFEIQIDDKLVKKNLIKTMILSAVAFSVIIFLYVRG